MPFQQSPGECIFRIKASAFLQNVQILAVQRRSFHTLPCINDTFPFQTVTIYGKKFRGHLKTVAQFFYFQFFIRIDVHQHFLIKAGQFRPDFTVNIFFQILVVFWKDIFYVFTIPIFLIQISQNLKRKRIAFR